MSLISSGFSYKPSKNSFRQNKDNINSKFYTNTNINVNNIKNLKLAWKYKDLPENKLEKYWMESVQISPVFADGKIFTWGWI